MPGQHVAVVIEGKTQWTGTLLGHNGPRACIQDDEFPRRVDEVQVALVMPAKDAPPKGEEVSHGE